MHIERSLEAALRSVRCPKALLVSLCYGGEVMNNVPKGAFNHHAAMPCVIRASTKNDPVVLVNGRRLAFWPTITEDFVVTSSIDPNTLDYSPSEVSFTLSAEAGFPRDLLFPGGTFGMHVTVDLWSHGVPLEQIEPLLIGNVTSSRFDRATGNMTFTATDAFISDDIMYPASQATLTRKEFPDILEVVDGRYNRQSILGPFDYPILCPQVDTIGSLFYLCDHKLRKPPTTVFVNGEKVDGWRLVSYRPPGFRSIIDNRPSVMTLIRLSEPTMLELPYVTCSGGYGYKLPKDPLTFFLEDVGGYEMTGMAKSIAKQFDFQLSVLNSASGTVLEIVRDRLMKQTGYSLGFYNRKAVFHALDGVKTGVKLSPSDGLRSIVENSAGETSAESVVNALEIGYTRNIFTDKEVDMSKHSYYLDKDNAEGELRRVLTKSEAMYGRRYKKIDFSDIVSEDGRTPEHIKRTARSILTHTALQHRLITYDCDWYPAFNIPLNGIVTIDDPDEFLSERQMRLVSRSVSSNSLQLTFEEENVQR